ncbi:hypothetical protein EMGBD1_12980 [Anaerolineaceae bacterium]|nr:hypothetical protein EMGBD1_12980 [Anaerolineaceae bacterium]
MTASKHSSSTQRGNAAGLLPVGILALAFGLRAFAVGRPALRGDEGFSVALAAKPVREMVALMLQSEPNPPLYFVALKGWIAIAGSSELALRWPSVLAGAVLVALTYRLGRAWLGKPAAAGAAVLAAFNPFLVWYAQDARVYSLLAALVLGAAWLTWRAAQKRDWQLWVWAGCLWWLALFAHYFAALALASILLALIVAAHTRARWRAAFGMSAGITLAQLPWLAYVAPLLVGHSKSWISAAGSMEVLWRLLTVFSAGQASAGASPMNQAIGALVLAALLIWGSVLLLRRALRAAAWVLALAVGTPLWLWLLSFYRPVFTEQYALVALPGVCLLAAAGLSGLAAAGWWGKAGRSFAYTTFIAISLLSLSNYYFNPRYSKSPDWRAVSDYLVRTARADEVVALNLPDPAFYYYYRAPMPVEAVPAAPLAEIGGAAAAAQLAQLRDSYAHVRFFFAPSALYDPQGFAGEWLQACCEKTDDQFVAGFRVQTFDTPAGSLAAQQPYRVDFGSDISLTGFRLARSAVQRGGQLQLTLFWLARAPIANSYTVFVHLLAPDGLTYWMAMAFRAMAAAPQTAGSRARR